LPLLAIAIGKRFFTSRKICNSLLALWTFFGSNQKARPSSMEQFYFGGAKFSVALYTSYTEMLAQYSRAQFYYGGAKLSVALHTCFTEMWAQFF